MMYGAVQVVWYRDVWGDTGSGVSCMGRYR